MQPAYSSFLHYLLIFFGSSLWRIGGAIDNSTKIMIETPTCTYQINHACEYNDKIRFILFTQQNKTNPIELDVTRTEPPTSYNGALPLKVVIHGFAASSFVYNIVKEYLKIGGYNILLVDWEQLSKKPCYLSAKVNTWQVGRCTGMALRQLVPASQIHIVGFSLGAHVAAIVSSYLNQQFGRKADRITGLDPALPLYATPLDDLKLDSSDADFVDVIHTSVGTFGKVEPCGHQDFYVNDYPTQPGCENYTNTVICSHARATAIFAESISSRIGFWAVPCYSIWYYILGNCETYSTKEEEILMGEYVDNRFRGIFTVKTSEYPPYALGRHSS